MMATLEEVLGEKANITVLRLLVNASNGMSGNDIARRVRAQQTTIRKALERLVVRGIVLRTNIGSAASYELNFRRQVVQRVIIPMYKAEAEVQFDLWASIVKLVSLLHPRPAAAILYGSVGRGERNPRDIDLLILVRSESSKEPVREAIANRSADLEEAFQLPVSPLILTETELEHEDRQAFLRNILRDGVFLVGKPTGALRRMRQWHRVPIAEP